MKEIKPIINPNHVEIAKRFPKLTASAIQEIISLWELDEDCRPTMQEICLTYGTSMTQLSRLLAEYGFKEHARYKTYHEEQLLNLLKVNDIDSLSKLRTKLNVY